MSYSPKFKKFTFLLLIAAMSSSLILQTMPVNAMMGDDSGESPPEGAAFESMPIHDYMKHLIKNNPSVVSENTYLREILLNLIYSSGTFLEERNLIFFDTELFRKAEKEDKYAWFVLDYSHFFLTKEMINGISLRAQKGEAPALFNLSLLHERGHGVDKKEDYARELLIKASDKGFARAQNHLGIKHNKLNDFNTAFDFFKKASDQGFPPAQHNLAKCYFSGGGCQKDLDQAIKYWVSAAMANHSPPKKMLRYLISINENRANPLFKPYVCQNMLSNLEQKVLSTLFYSPLKEISEDLLAIEKCTPAFNRPGFLITCIDFKSGDYKTNKNSKFIRRFKDYICFGEENVRDAFNLLGALERLENNPDIESVLTLHNEVSKEDKKEAAKFFFTLEKSQQKINALVEELGTQIYLGERRRNRNFIDEYGDLFK